MARSLIKQTGKEYKVLHKMWELELPLELWKQGDCVSLLVTTGNESYKTYLLRYIILTGPHLAVYIFFKLVDIFRLGKMKNWLFNVLHNEQKNFRRN